MIYLYEDISFWFHWWLIFQFILFYLHSKYYPLLVPPPRVLQNSLHLVCFREGVPFSLPPEHATFLGLPSNCDLPPRGTLPSLCSPSTWHNVWHTLWTWKEKKNPGKISWFDTINGWCCEPRTGNMSEWVGGVFKEQVRIVITRQRKLFTFEIWKNF